METAMIVGIAGVLIGLIGIGVAIYEGRKYRGPKIGYQYDGFNLIRSYNDLFSEDLEVTFEGKRVPNLTHSQIVVWNCGNSPITNKDISDIDKLYITFGDDVKILRAGIAKNTNQSNNASIKYKPEDSRMLFSFDFLDSKDGILLSVWHTNPNPAPSFLGTIINKKAGPFNMGRFAGPRPNVESDDVGKSIIEKISGSLLLRNPAFLSLVSIIMGLVSLLVSSLIFSKLHFGLPFIGESAAIEDEGTSRAAASFLAGIGTAYLGIGLWMWKQVRRRFPKQLLPDEYRGG